MSRMIVGPRPLEHGGKRYASGDTVPMDNFPATVQKRLVRGGALIEVPDEAKKKTTSRKST